MEFEPMTFRIGVLNHSAKLSSKKLHYLIYLKTQLKTARDEQGTKRIQDSLFVVVFYVNNKLLTKFWCSIRREDRN